MMKKQRGISLVDLLVNLLFFTVFGGYFVYKVYNPSFESFADDIEKAEPVVIAEECELSDEKCENAIPNG
jgi:hypothetical protein